MDGWMDRWMDGWRAALADKVHKQGEHILHFTQMQEQKHPYISSSDIPTYVAVTR